MSKVSAIYIKHNHISYFKSNQLYLGIILDVMKKLSFVDVDGKLRCTTVKNCHSSYMTSGKTSKRRKNGSLLGLAQRSAQLSRNMIDKHPDVSDLSRADLKAFDQVTTGRREELGNIKTSFSLATTIYMALLKQLFIRNNSSSVRAVWRLDRLFMIVAVLLVFKSIVVTAGTYIHKLFQ